MAAPDSTPHDPSDDEAFHGRIGRTLADSTPWWPAGARAPAGAPNVVFIVLDDVGFSDLGCYGAEIETPVMDALAAGGLRYNNFHVTAMCSPTRACLLTGRNAHAVGVGAIAEWANGFPGYQGRISKKAATAAEIFSSHHYGAYAIGKWHLSNLANYPVAGPHEHWPLGRGFSRWYGFLGGYVDHWNPDLHEDNHPSRHARKPGYHLSEDLVDHTIEHVRDHVGSAAGRPFFLYLAFGAAHWPHHVPEPYIAKYAGRYDTGWDVIREARLAKQKALGIVPENTALAPRNPGVQAWAALSSDERRVFTRLQETYAAFMDHTDEQIGRVVSYLKQIGQFDNTVIVLLSDNGASGEGGATGALNIRKHVLTEPETAAYGLEHLDKIGGEHSFPHYPHGWAQVSNTPLKWYKKNTHGGGIRAPLIVHWPAGIRDAGGIRSQYHHVIDVLPTMLEIAGLQAPTSYRGVPQMPLHGQSMAYSFEHPDAPTTKRVQHFEIVGDRALWQDGWKAVARHRKGDDFEADRWELYHLDDDFAETFDLAARHPERLNAMIELWWQEAEAHGVLPLDDRDKERALDWVRANAPERHDYLPGMARADRLLVPALTDRSWEVEAMLELPADLAQGVILSCGNRFGGFSLHCQGGEAVFEYVYTEAVNHRLAVPLHGGPQCLRLRFHRAAGSGGQFVLSNDDQVHDRVDVSRTWPAYGLSAGLTCGYANAPVSETFEPPFAFDDGLLRVSLALLPLDSGMNAGDVRHGAYGALMQEE